MAFKNIRIENVAFRLPEKLIETTIEIENETGEEMVVIVYNYANLDGEQAFVGRNKYSVKYVETVSRFGVQGQAYRYLLKKVE